LVQFKETESPESTNTNVAGENNVNLIFYTKGIIHQELLLEKQIQNDTFLKEVILMLIARVHCVRPGFQEIGSWYLMPNSVPAHYSGILSKFLTKRGIAMISHPSYPPDLAAK
jgi:hypothetical protein